MILSSLCFCWARCISGESSCCTSFTAAGLLRWRSPPRQQLSEQTQTGPDQQKHRVTGQKGALHINSEKSFLKGGKVLQPHNVSHIHTQSWYLGANQAGSLVSDVLECGSNVDLLYS